MLATVVIWAVCTLFETGGRQGWGRGGGGILNRLGRRSWTAFLFWADLEVEADEDGVCGELE